MTCIHVKRSKRRRKIFVVSSASGNEPRILGVWYQKFAESLARGYRVHCTAYFRLLINVSAPARLYIIPRRSMRLTLYLQHFQTRFVPHKSSQNGLLLTIALRFASVLMPVRLPQIIWKIVIYEYITHNIFDVIFYLCKRQMKVLVPTPLFIDKLLKGVAYIHIDDEQICVAPHNIRSKNEYSFQLPRFESKHVMSASIYCMVKVKVLV